MKESRSLYIKHTDFIGKSFDIFEKGDINVLTVTKDKFKSDGYYRFIVDFSKLKINPEHINYVTMIVLIDNIRMVMLSVSAILDDLDKDGEFIYSGRKSVTIWINKNNIETDVKININVEGANPCVSGIAYIVEG